jgi:hypothetical protein
MVHRTREGSIQQPIRSRARRASGTQPECAPLALLGPPVAAVRTVEGCSQLAGECWGLNPLVETVSSTARRSY